MKKVDEARHSSLLETKGYMISHSADWTGDTPITDDNTMYNSMLDAVALNKQKHLTILIGYTIDKSNKEQLLVNDLLFVMPAIRTWASRPAINRPDIKGQATMPESAIPLLADTVLLDKAKAMKKLIEDNPTIIDPLYVPLARKALFDQHILDYEAVVEMPETMIDERAVATQNMIAGITEAVKFRKDIMLDTVKRLRETKPEFFQGFKQSMKIDNNPSGTLSVQGNISNEQDNTALSNVTCYIPALDKKAKSGEKGNFRFKSLPAGEYTIIFTKFGFEPQTKTIAVNDGERTELTVKLVPKVFPE